MAMKLLDRAKARVLESAFHFLAKRTFSLKQPGPLKQWAADILGVSKGSASKPYSQSIWVYRSLKLWQRLAQVPILLKSKSGDPLDTGAVAYLLKSPNSRMTQEQLIEWLVLSLGTHGEYFLLREDGLNETGVPSFIVPVMPNRMKLQDRDIVNGVVVSWTMDIGNGKTVRLPAKGVIHDCFPNPYNPSRGLGPLDAARLSVDADFAARIHNKFMMERHGRISHLVSFKQDVGADTLKVYADMWREKYEGNENSGRTAFVDNDASVAQLALSSKDLDWLEGQKLSREEICAAYGIPPPVAGILDRATYENISQANKMLWSECLIPIGNRIAAKINKELVEPNERGAVASFDYMNHVPALQEEEGLRVERYLKLVNEGFVTPETAAKTCKIDLGENNEAHGKIWISYAKLTTDQILTGDSVLSDTVPTEPAAAPSTPKDDEDDPGDDEPPSNGKKAMSRDRSEVRQAKGRTIIRDASAWERRLSPALKRFFWEQRQTVMANAERIESAVKSFTKTRAPADKYAKTAQEIADALMEGKHWDKELMAKVEPILREAGKSGAMRILSQIRRPVNTFRDAILDEYVRDQGILMQEINNTTKIALQKVSGTMVDSLNKGESVTDIMAKFRDDLRGVFNNTEARRRTIARTESLRAYNGGQHAMMEDADIERKEWLTIGDGDVRDSHRDIDGAVASLNGTFSNGLRYPGDPLGSPEETINCRCSLLPVIE